MLSFSGREEELLSRFIERYANRSTKDGDFGYSRTKTSTSNYTARKHKLDRAYGDVNDDENSEDACTMRSSTNTLYSGYGRNHDDLSMYSGSIGKRKIKLSLSSQGGYK